MVLSSKVCYLLITIERNQHLKRQGCILFFQHLKHWDAKIFKTKIKAENQKKPTNKKKLGALGVRERAVQLSSVSLRASNL